MVYNIYKIDTTLRSEGKTYQVRYRPRRQGRSRCRDRSRDSSRDHSRDRCYDSDYDSASGSDKCGGRYYRYVRSYDEYLEKLRYHLTSRKVRLYTITASGEATEINSNWDLYRAVKYLPNGGELAVIAVMDDGGCSDNDPDIPGPYKNDLDCIFKKFKISMKCWYDCCRKPCSTRYNWYWSNKYYLCPDCYCKLPDYKKCRWIKSNKAGSPWCKDVPDPTLYKNSDYDSDVRHLEYILCRLGFMNLSSVRCPGIYDDSTARAVKRFRDYKKLFHSNCYVYDRRTANKLQDAVHDFRDNGALFI